MGTRTWTVVGVGVLAGAVAMTVPSLPVAPAADGFGDAVVIAPPSAEPTVTAGLSPSAVPSREVAAVAPSEQTVGVRPAPPRNVQQPQPVDPTDSPDEPDTPDEPDLPDEPDEPDTPDEPDLPDEPDEADGPD